MSKGFREMSMRYYKTSMGFYEMSRKVSVRCQTDSIECLLYLMKFFKRFCESLMGFYEIFMIFCGVSIDVGRFDLQQLQVSFMGRLLRFEFIYMSDYSNRECTVSG